MGLLDTEIKELRQMSKHFMAGKITAEQVQIQIAIFSQTEKRVKTMISIAMMAAKHGKKHADRLMKTNLIGNGTVIDLSPEEIEQEKILCPLNDAYKLRSQCLDFSGEPEHEDDCRGCDVGMANKKLLVGPPMYVVE